MTERSIAKLELGGKSRPGLLILRMLWQKPAPRQPEGKALAPRPLTGEKPRHPAECGHPTTRGCVNRATNLERLFAIGRLADWVRRPKEAGVMWNGWSVGVSKRGSDGRSQTDFYDVAIGDFDKALSAVRSSVGKAREAHVWIKEPLQDWRIMSLKLLRGEVRRRSA